MTDVTCRPNAKNWDQLRNPMLGNLVWATFTFFYVVEIFATCKGVTKWLVQLLHATAEHVGLMIKNMQTHLCHCQSHFVVCVTDGVKVTKCCHILSRIFMAQSLLFLVLYWASCGHEMLLLGRWCDKVIELWCWPRESRRWGSLPLNAKLLLYCHRCLKDCLWSLILCRIPFHCLWQLIH